MDGKESYVLTVNAGSSSIKFDLFAQAETPRRSLSGVIDKIGQPQARLSVKVGTQPHSTAKKVDAPDHAAAVRILSDWLHQNVPGGHVAAIGHRIVHGGPHYAQPCRLTSEVIEQLRQLTVLDPEHLPLELNLIEMLQERFPDAVQIACFDTGFHHDLPAVAQLLPIPRRYQAQGLRRYGFHGLSYSFLLQELRRLDDKGADGRLVLAHMGHGVSLAAVQDGTSIDTTMGLTPAGGVPMSSRSGDLDPGVLSYLARTEHLTANAFDRLVNFESGLLGLSETTADMEELLQREAEDERAAEAVAVFCYQVKKTVGALAAALGGLDQLVFTGGMGENAPKIRARVCQGLDFLGLQLDQEANNAGAGVISAADSRVKVRIIHTDEASIIAEAATSMLKDIVGVTPA